MQKSQASRTERYWVVWRHDNGEVVHQQDRPEVKTIPGERDVSIAGPFFDRNGAEKRLEYLHSRCPRSIVNGRNG